MPFINPTAISGYDATQKKKPSPNEQDLNGLPCPTRANFWMIRCYDRESSLGCSHSTFSAKKLASEVELGAFQRESHIDLLSGTDGN